MDIDHAAELALVLRRTLRKDMTLLAIFLFIEPLARGLKRLAAARLVFIFGICRYLFI